MSKLSITNAGVIYKDEVFTGQETENLTHFIFANIPDLSLDDDIDLKQSIPTDNIVHSQKIERLSKLNDNAIVMSSILGYDVGDFKYNWFGVVAKKSDGTQILIAVVQTELQTKKKTQGPVSGNYSVKSIVWRTSAIAQSLDVSLNTLPWQVESDAFVTSYEFEEHTHNIKELEQIELLATKNELKAYAKSEDIPSIDNLALKSDLAKKLDKNAGNEQIKPIASAHGSLSIDGIKSTYAGINFLSNNMTLMMNKVHQGVFDHDANSWIWYFSNGDLTKGTVPFANVTGTENLVTYDKLPAPQTAKTLNVLKNQSPYIHIGGSGSWTTAQFLAWLSSVNAFEQTYFVIRGSWSYANNRIITDTGCGAIQLAGSVVEVIGNANQHTIRITTATTGSGYLNSQFTYINNGTGYAPKWHRDYNTLNKPSLLDLGAASNVDLAKKLDKNAGNQQIKSLASAHGSVTVDGSKAGYAGINFSSNNITLMMHLTVQGAYNHNNNAWLWYFSNGVLTTGKVPLYNVTGTEDLAKKSESDSKYALKTASYTIAQSNSRYALTAASYTKAASDGRYAYKAASYTKAESDAKYLSSKGWTRVVNRSNSSADTVVSSANMLGKEIYIVCSDISSTDEIGVAHSFCPRISRFNSDAIFNISVGGSRFWWKYASGKCNIDGDLNIRQIWVRERTMFPDIGTLIA